MSLPNKLSAFLITLIFSNCALAVIVEGGFSGQVTDEFVEEFDANASQSRIADNYENKNGISLNEDFASYEPQIPNLNSLSADQSFSLLLGPNVYDNVVSYAGFENSGIASRADYHGWMAVNLSATKVDIEETVTVPEPSSLLLFFGPLLFIFWRASLLPKFTRKR